MYLYAMQCGWLTRRTRPSHPSHPFQVPEGVNKVCTERKNFQFDLVAALRSPAHVGGGANRRCQRSWIGTTLTLHHYYTCFGVGCTSSIHRLGGLFATVTRRALLPSLLPSLSLSAYRPLAGRTGHGRMLDAETETVTTAAMKVKPKSEETNWRFWVKRSARCIVNVD